MTHIEAPFVLALGDSLTAGYGLHPSASFASRLQEMLCAHIPAASVHNAGVSGDTTDGGLKRLPRLLTSLPRKPDLAIVELGANDFLRGVRPERTRTNLDEILELLGRCGIRALLATFEAPRFLDAFGARYDGIYAGLAAKHGIASAPFFPPGVLGHPELVLADRIHPNGLAIERVATAFLPAVLAALESDRSEAA